MRKKRILIGALVLCLSANPLPVMATESTPTLEELQKQIEALTKEDEELKNQLGVSDTSSDSSQKDSIAAESVSDEAPSVSDDIANADTTIEYNDIATVQMVQIALNEAGYNCGTADGKAGPKTREQISLYQTGNNLTVNGLITEQLIKSLGIADKVEENAKAEAEKATYSTEYSYDQLARTPDTYKGQKVKFSGQVIQGLEYADKDLGSIILKINSNYDTVYCVYTLSDLNFRVLDDDNITIYGVASGMYSYETVRGNTLTIPLIYVDYIDLN